MSTSSSGISTEVVVGIAIAVAAVLVSFCLSWKKRRRRSNDHRVPPPPPGYKTAKIPNSEDVTTGDNGASSSIAPGSTYEVFLSFRGADIRLGFTDHLYCNLTGAGIRTFRDNEELRVGEEIGPDLMKAIEESSISIPIFSKDYASSKWCLSELAHMVKRMNDKEGRQRHTVCPIFYDVTPEHVKHQAGSFEQAFKKHAKDKKLDPSTVQEWKDALKEVSELKGWEKAKIADGHEGQLVDKIVTEVCKMLKKRNVHLTGDLVGMEHHWEEMTKLLDIYSDNGVRIVGIIGMGGIGKTTIAKYTYNQLCDHFQQQCSFLEDVRENVKRNNGCAELQEKLISDVLKRSADKTTLDIRTAFSHKKVLIVLDDVEKRAQLTEIIGGLAYFGSESRIIVTTRNKDVFIESEGDLIYEPSFMDADDSLLLFCKYAFKSNQPREGYEVISSEIAQIAAGLPLSLRVIGSMLFEKTIEKWKPTLNKLRKIPAADVKKKLKISYDTLEPNQQQMFLDIACHFIEEDKTYAFYMWEDCGLNPESCEGIDVLVSRSLITIEKQFQVPSLDKVKEWDVFRMHDQLRDLGRDIVKQENQSHPGKRSRLWSDEEVREVLVNQSGTEKVETLFVKNTSFYNLDCMSNDDFKGMSRLRYLCLEGPMLNGDFKGLVSNLRWFSWRRMDLNFEGCGSGLGIPITNFCPHKLVVLDLSESSIRDGWESWIQIKAASNLKVLNLSKCNDLTKFSECLWNMKSLVELDLSNTGITELSEQGIGNLTNLTKLLLSTSRIKRLPDAIGKLEKLEELNCSGCESLEAQLPEGIGRLSSLRILNLSCTKIDTLPEDVGSLCNLRKLNLSCNSQLKTLSGAGIERLQKLEELDCSGCESLEGLPEGIGRLSSLRYLDLSFIKMDTLPKDIGSLCNLRRLHLGWNSQLKKLLGVGIERLQKLEVLDCSYCESLEGQLPEGIGGLSSLEVLDLSFTKIDTLPEDVGSLCNLRELNLSGTSIKKLPGAGIERLQKLEELDCSGCESLEGQLPEGIGRLSSLTVLNLSFTKIDTLPKDVGSLCNLWSLHLSYNSKLKKLPGAGIERLLKLEVLDCSSCTSLEGQLPEGIWCLPNLGVLEFSHTKITGGIPKDISGLSKLKTLDLGRCEKLRLPVEGLELPPSLTRVDIPLSEASVKGVRGLVNLRDLTFHKNVGYCCEPVAEEEEVGMMIDMPNNLEDLRLYGFDDHVMRCRPLRSMKFDSSSSLNSLCISRGTMEGLPPLDLSVCQMIKELSIGYCPHMRSIRGIENFTSLKELSVRDCPLLKRSDLPNLESLEVIGGD